MGKQMKRMNDKANILAMIQSERKDERVRERRKIESIFVNEMNNWQATKYRK